MKEKFDTLSAYCSKATTKHYSTSFSLGIYYLSKPMRPPIYAIYGFVRLADEIVDSFHAYDKVLLLAELRRDCFNAIERGISVNPVMNSFQQVVNQYNISLELVDLFLQSMEMDLKPQEYTAEKYDQYILGSAQVVGLMCLQVFIHGDQDQYELLRESAMRLGSAFQKVNFLRDLQADHQELQRSYFPEVDLHAFTNEDKRHIENDIRADFDAALHGINQLPLSCRRGVYLAYVYYKKLFQKISRKSASSILSGRIRVSNGHKFWLLCNSFLRFKMNVL